MAQILGDAPRHTREKRLCVVSLGVRLMCVFLILPQERFLAIFVFLCFFTGRVLMYSLRVLVGNSNVALRCNKQVMAFSSLLMEPFFFFFAEMTLCIEVQSVLCMVNFSLQFGRRVLCYHI